MKVFNKSKYQAGFSLIEVLVTLLVLSIGLLGLAGLQGRSLINSNESYHRSTVTNLSNDIINRMTANRVSALNAGYHTNTAGGLSIEAVDCDTATGCSAGDLIGHDLFSWDADLNAQLESGQGLVCLDSTPNDNDASPNDGRCDTIGPVYAIKIWWGPDLDNDNVPDFSFVTSYQP